MEAFERLRAVAVPMIRANIDTDAIIPSREIRSVSRTGLAQGLFAGWRYTSIGGREPNPDFILNQPAYAGAQILLGGENFGCGSSREQAVWALKESGFRVVIAPSFAPIFYGNCIRNGVVPVRLPRAAITALAEEVTQDPRTCQITVDLRVQRVFAPDGAALRFSIEPEAREMLLEGLDAIDLTLRHRADIENFWRQDRMRRPWIYLEP
jgi:3-isopropylmalate/(R)-2-methylmalate dehydratase small subunit